MNFSYDLTEDWGELPIYQIQDRPPAKIEKTNKKTLLVRFIMSGFSLTIMYRINGNCFLTHHAPSSINIGQVTEDVIFLHFWCQQDCHLLFRHGMGGQKRLGEDQYRMAVKEPCRSPQSAVCELRRSLEYNLKILSQSRVLFQSTHLGLQVIKNCMFRSFQHHFCGLQYTS